MTLLRTFNTIIAINRKNSNVKITFLNRLGDYDFHGQFKRFHKAITIAKIILTMPVIRAGRTETVLSNEHHRRTFLFGIKFVSAVHRSTFSDRKD